MLSIVILSLFIETATSFRSTHSTHDTPNRKCWLRSMHFDVEYVKCGHYLFCFVNYVEFKFYSKTKKYFTEDINGNENIHILCWAMAYRYFPFIHKGWMYFYLKYWNTLLSITKQ